MIKEIKISELKVPKQDREPIPINSDLFIIVDKDYNIIDGVNRLEAHKLRGKETVLVYIIDENNKEVTREMEGDFRNSVIKELSQFEIPIEMSFEDFYWLILNYEKQVDCEITIKNNRVTLTRLRVR